MLGVSGKTSRTTAPPAHAAIASRNRQVADPGTKARSRSQEASGRRVLPAARAACAPLVPAGPARSRPCRVGRPPLGPLEFVRPRDLLVACDKAASRTPSPRACKVRVRQRSAPPAGIGAPPASVLVRQPLGVRHVLPNPWRPFPGPGVVVPLALEEVDRLQAGGLETHGRHVDQPERRRTNAAQVKVGAVVAFKVVQVACRRGGDVRMPTDPGRPRVRLGGFMEFD